MISQIPNTLTYSPYCEAQVNGLAPHTKEMWDSPPDEAISQIKNDIRAHLLSNQNELCGYCALDLGGTSEGQIEHIAPKARYPQFTFEKANLVMACHYCNGFSKKGNHNTISVLNLVYDNCTFKLVHPYFDDPSIHYEWIAQNKKIIIKGISAEGLYSIKIFKLAEPRMTELRAKKVISEIVIANVTTPQIDDQLIQETINYK